MNDTSDTMNPLESQSGRSWKSPQAPEHILVIRFHALGDVAITLPYCNALKKRFPRVRIDFLTSTEANDLPSSLSTFGKVIAMDMRSSRSARCWSALRLCASLHHEYDIVLDLQRNWLSRLIRTLLDPHAWSEFDRFSPTSAGDRVQQAMAASGIPGLDPEWPLPIHSSVADKGRSLLHSAGWDGTKRLVLVNPAGLWKTRQWPVESYVEYCKRWQQKESVSFVFLGTDRVKPRVRQICQALGEGVLDFTGATSLDEAFGVIQHLFFALSEDSGLMHMAWVCGIPTLALFGSSRHDWSRPLGNHSDCLHSGDLPCGACMEPECRFGDVHCLTRFRPSDVFAQSLRLLETAHTNGSERRCA